MFKVRSKDAEHSGNSALRLLRLLAWGALAVLWFFILFLMGHYWLEEIPKTRNMYAAGLEQGFDALSGIIAACDPSWQQVEGILGRPIGGRLNKLQGDTTFDVWKESDNEPGWHSGLASLRFDQRGRLLWVRRYFIAAPPLMSVNQNSGESFPVIKPRLDLRGQNEVRP